jgi:hypothetical protein
MSDLISLPPDAEARQEMLGKLHKPSETPGDSARRAEQNVEHAAAGASRNASLDS